MTTGATRTSVSATTPDERERQAGLERLRHGRPALAPVARRGSQPESKRWPPARGPCVGCRRSGPRTSATSALGELVAGAPDRQHELRHRRVVLDLVAQVAHVDVDRLLVLVERLVVAQQLEQLAPR